MSEGSVWRILNEMIKIFGIDTSADQELLERIRTLLFAELRHMYYGLYQANPVLNIREYDPAIIISLLHNYQDFCNYNGQN